MNNVNVNVVIGMVCFILAVLFGRYIKVGDFILGLLYGVSIGFLVVGLYKIKL